MKRRQFITLLGGAAAWPLAAHGQQPTMPVIGFLNGGFAESYAQHVAAFHQGLRQSGYVEGQNIAIEYRWANGRFEDLQPLAADLVNRQVAVIATSGSGAALAAKGLTATIPVVFNVTDPVGIGLVKNLARPGANATGIDVVAGELGPKRLGLLRELVPTATSVGLLVNANSPVAGLQTRQMKEAAQALGMRVEAVQATGQDTFEAAFASLVQRRTQMLVVAADPFFNNRREQLVALAARYRIPAIYEWREFVEIGGLMSYGADLKEAYRQIGYAARSCCRRR